MDASVLRAATAARLRASRRVRARAGKHHRGVRSRPCGRCRRTRARRAPVRRRRRRRLSRRHAGSHDGRSRSGLAARTAAELARVDAGHRFVDTAGAFPFRGLGVGIPTLRDVLRRYPDMPAHRRDEGRHDGDGAGRRRRLCVPPAPSTASARPATDSSRSTRRAPRCPRWRRVPAIRKRAGPSIARSRGGRCARPATSVSGPRDGGTAPHRLAALHPPRACRRVQVQVWTVDEERTWSGSWHGVSTG